jgi:hypothetical protein
MRHIKILSVVIVLLALEGCVTRDCSSGSGDVLQGTNTAVVGLFVDDDKNPQTAVDKVTVRPGQKIIFAGPDKFEILFKDQRSPIGELEIESSGGVIVIEIPADIFERDQRETKSTERKTELVYRYGIRVNGKVTDPSIHIIRS